MTCGIDPRRSIHQVRKAGFLRPVPGAIVSHAFTPAGPRAFAARRAQLDRTYFAWSGPTDANSVFCYRIDRPVILIEFDRQRPVDTRHLIDPSRPTRQHIHAVVRTPNGNDYDKDLLRQH